MAIFTLMGPPDFQKKMGVPSLGMLLFGSSSGLSAISCDFDNVGGAMTTENSGTGTSGVRALLSRTEVEDILKKNYNVRLAGFWRWLYEQGEIDSKDPSEDINPYIMYDKHKDVIHKELSSRSPKTLDPIPNCRICGLFSALSTCWTVATIFDHPFREILLPLAEFQEDVECIWKVYFGKEGVYLKANNRLDPLLRKGAVNKEKQCNITVFPAEQLLLSESVRIRSSMRRLYKDIERFLNGASGLMTEKVIPALYMNEQDLFYSSICYSLGNSGFRNMEIADILRGANPYPRSKMGGKETLTAEARKARDAVGQRKSRYKKWLEKS